MLVECDHFSLVRWWSAAPALTNCFAGLAPPDWPTSSIDDLLGQNMIIDWPSEAALSQDAHVSGCMDLKRGCRGTCDALLSASRFPTEQRLSTWTGGGGGGWDGTTWRRWGPEITKNQKQKTGFLLIDRGHKGRRC